MPLLKTLVIAAALASLLPLARAQDADDTQTGLSRPMKTAIHFFEQGDDVQAMDRFMEILTKGDPSERSMANEYINLITHRMNSGGGYGGSPAPKAPANAPGASGGDVVAEGVAAPNPRPSHGDELDESESDGRKARRPVARATRSDEMSASNKALMRKEIRARLHAAQERSLVDLKAVEGVRVVMRENGDPAALGIPSPLLFQSGISFLRDASKILDPLTKLVFALGSTQVLILPEGTAMGDAKVLDMRRTMGVSAALYQAGVAPPRVRVNLLNTQVDIPKSLLDFKGVVIVFLYDQPMILSVESAIGDEQGPPISLGVFPQQIRPSRNQGAIIEFSVSDPPAGLVSWKFQLLQPARDGSELAPLQEVVGGGPVFHQIFWNGRQNYFSSPLPTGRYECILSALDAKNRQRTLHRWIRLLGDEGDSEKMLATGPGTVKSSSTMVAPPDSAKTAAGAPAAPSEDLPGGDAKPLVKGLKPAAKTAAFEVSPRRGSSSKRTVVRRGVRAKKASKDDKGKSAKATQPKAASAKDADGASASAPSPAEKPGRYVLAFARNTHQLTPASEKTLAKAATDISVYPLETLQVIGHAAPDEQDADKLSDNRARMIVGLMINRYQIPPAKITMTASASAGEGATVELVLARSDR